MKRPCLECGRLTNGGSRHPECHRAWAIARERRRGDRVERGYGQDHRAARAALMSMLPAECGYGCGVTLYPGSRWVAAHVVDGEPEHGWLAACPSCNERAKRGHRGGRLTTQREDPAVPPSNFPRGIVQ